MPRISFQLILRSSKLWIPPYSKFQEDLHEKILSLRDEGMSYNKIASYLNQNGVRTVRNHTFSSSHVHSIVKKKAIRDERLSREYPIKIQDFSIKFY